MMRHPMTLIGMLLITLAWAMPAFAEPGPREIVEQANQRIHKLVSQELPEGSPQAAARDLQLKTVVNEFLDIDNMAREALGRTWEERTPEEQTQYLGLMRQLVERSYLRQTRSRVNYTVTFGTEDINERRGEAEVETKLRISTRGRIEEVEVFYTLSLQDGTWKVTDVETDGASTVRNYRAQFRRIIQREGFDELLTRMRSRLEAGESDL